MGNKKSSKDFLGKRMLSGNPAVAPRVQEMYDYYAKVKDIVERTNTALGKRQSVKRTYSVTTEGSITVGNISTTAQIFNYTGLE